MQNKLQELTEKIYKEGVNKANQESEQILNKARNEANAILEQAKKQAEAIIQDAHNTVSEIKRKTESEIKQAALQSLKTVQQQVTNLISSKIIDSQLKESFQDTTFLKQLIETAVKSWSANQSSVSLLVLLPPDKVKELDEFIKANIGKQLNAGIEIKADSGIKSGFKISPADGSYQISFKEEDFATLFKNYLKPKTVELLFGGR